jgi:hypothetical protein
MLLQERRCRPTRRKACFATPSPGGEGVVRASFSCLFLRVSVVVSAEEVQRDVGFVADDP